LRQNRREAKHRRQGRLHRRLWIVLELRAHLTEPVDDALEVFRHFQVGGFTSQQIEEVL
jgi:hypothetical protein